jgi:hypothetical protein
MRPGEQVPPIRDPEPHVQPTIRGDDAFEIVLPGPIDQPWWVVVRYADGFGRNWELRAPLAPEAPLRGPVRLRAGRFDRWRPSVAW